MQNKYAQQQNIQLCCKYSYICGQPKCGATSSDLCSLVIGEVIGRKVLLISLPHSAEEYFEVLGIELGVEERGDHSRFLYT